MAFHWAEESAEFSREMGIEAISAFNVAGGVKFLGGWLGVKLLIVWL
jgi:hypothetical protein